MVTHQLQVKRRTGKVRRPETDVLPLCHATNYDGLIIQFKRFYVYVIAFTCVFLCENKDDDVDVPSKSPSLSI